MTTNISTNFYKFNALDSMYANIYNDEMVLYLYIGDFEPHVNNVVQPVYDSPYYNDHSVYRKMILGKKLTSSDVSYVIRYIPWESDKIFDIYDDQDNYLKDNDFYCITHEGSFYHVWKCLDNNNGSNSTAQPLFSDIGGANSVLYQTVDGYRWKYMNSVDSDTVGKFAVGTDYFPVVSNSTVASSAQNGRIDIIKVDNQGRYYNNYIDGVFKTNDISINGDKKLLNISNTAVITVNGYYTGCLLYVTSGDATGEYRYIINYNANSQGNIIEIDSELNNNLHNTDQYQIRPNVLVIGDGSQSVNCVARALVNSYNSNSIYRVEILNGGLGYKAATANVVANSILGIANTAEVRPIISPYGGHGFDQYNELYTHDLCVSGTLSNTELGKIPATNKFQQFGLIADPTFANVQINFNIATTNYIEGEIAHEVSPMRIAAWCNVAVGNNYICISNTASDGTVAVTSGQRNIIGTGTRFLIDYAAGDFVYIKGASSVNAFVGQVNNVVNNTLLYLINNTSFSNSSAKIGPAFQRSSDFVTQIRNGSYLIIATQNFEQAQLVVVNNVVNSQFLYLTSNCNFSCTATYVYNTNVISSFDVVSVGSDFLVGNNVRSSIKTGSMIIGNTSGAVGFVNNFSRNDVIKDFGTFIQMYKYTVTIVNGVFTEGEEIRQSVNNGIYTEIKSGYLHSISGSGIKTIYTNTKFDSGLNIIGVSSGATATVETCYDPELVVGSGAILYIENCDAVTRQADQSENFKIVLNT